jgi:hypothetical protein
MCGQRCAGVCHTTITHDSPGPPDSLLNPVPTPVFGTVPMLHVAAGGGRMCALDHVRSLLCFGNQHLANAIDSVQRAGAGTAGQRLPSVGRDYRAFRLRLNPKHPPHNRPRAALQCKSRGCQRLALRRRWRQSSAACAASWRLQWACLVSREKRARESVLIVGPPTSADQFQARRTMRQAHCTFGQQSGPSK